MPVFQTIVVGTYIERGVPKTKYRSGLFISSRADGLTEEQLASIKREILQELGVPAYLVHFEVGCQEVYQPHISGFVRFARIDENDRTPKPRPL